MSDFSEQIPDAKLELTEGRTNLYSFCSTSEETKYMTLQGL